MVDTFSSIYTNVLTGTGFSIADELSFPMRSDLFHTEYLPNAASAVLFLSRRTDDARMKEVGRCLEERFAEILEEMAGIDKER